MFITKIFNFSLPLSVPRNPLFPFASLSLSFGNIGRTRTDIRSHEKRRTALSKHSNVARGRGKGVLDDDVGGTTRKQSHVEERHRGRKGEENAAAQLSAPLNVAPNLCILGISLAPPPPILSKPRETELGRDNNRFLSLSLLTPFAPPPFPFSSLVSASLDRGTSVCLVSANVPRPPASDTRTFDRGEMTSACAPFPSPPPRF